MTLLVAVLLSLNPYSNGMKIEQQFCQDICLRWCRLNPYSNGMKIELDNAEINITRTFCLNPYSNGMKIEQKHPASIHSFQIVLILILME